MHICKQARLAGAQEFASRLFLADSIAPKAPILLPPRNALATLKLRAMF
jgi:hypothetical protein